MFLDKLRSWKHAKYIRNLVRKGLTLGEGVYLNDGFFIDPSHCDLISIGSGTTFGPGVMILSHDASGKLTCGETTFDPVIIENNVFIGARAIILPGSHIGEGAIIGAGAVVKGDIPAGEIWAGVPARRIGLVDETLSLQEEQAYTI